MVQETSMGTKRLVSWDSDMPPVKTRNKRIGGSLVQRKLAEEKGTGVRTIFRSMKRNGNFTPEFQFDEMYFRVRLRRHPKFMVRELLTTTNQLVAEGEQYERFITDGVKRRAALSSELYKWCAKDPLDITVGVDIVQCPVNEGATSDNDALQGVANGSSKSLGFAKF